MLHSNMRTLFGHVDRIFNAFYEQLLSNETFAVYFDGAEQIEGLLQKQKRNFKESIDEDEESFRERFYGLGMLHYRLEIPYEAFYAGTRLLNKEFIAVIVEEGLDSRLVLEVNDYFTKSSEALAKGYLDAFIATDKRDLSVMIDALEATMNNQKAKEILKLHYLWLDDLFSAIEEEDRSIVGELNHEESKIFNLIRQSAAECELLDDAQFEQMEHVYHKIFKNARNIFFFIEEKIYTEALSLFVNLLEIYKFTLMFTNMINTVSNLKSQHMLQIKTKLAEEDPLTGAVNRRKFDELLSEYIGEAKTVGRGVAMLLIDIDDFKKVNDRYGHQAGDAVLKRFASLLMAEVGEEEQVVRYGGEEFVVLCFWNDVQRAAALAERLRTRVEAHPFEKVGTVTASFGVATMEEADDVTSLFERADRNMYRAKSEGKNRVVY